MTASAAGHDGRTAITDPPRSSSGTPAPAPDASELRQAARGGAITLVGSSFSTAMGFALAIVLARQLGAAGSGVVLQTIAAFMIALSAARLGMDTTAVWVVPRLKEESPESVRGACAGLLMLAALAGCLVVALWWVVRWAVGDPGGAQGVPSLTGTISAVSWALPLGSVMLVALAATRGFGGVRPFNLIGNLALPGSRPLGVWAVTAAGGGVLAAALAWAVPLLPAVLVALWVLTRQVRGFERRRGVKGDLVPTSAVRRRLLGFGLPRTVSSLLEQSIIWSDVVLVGLIAGPAAAGIYGAASRFVGAGVIVLTALRIVVAPRFSAYLAREDREQVQQLYTVTAGWILLLGTPIYVLLAWFAPTVLGWLGAEFVDGVPAMVVLCLGAIGLLVGGNVQSLLLMSGRSGWGAVNKLVVFAANITGNLLLIPVLGFLGAAATWAGCMALDTTLALVQVYRFSGIRPALGRIVVILTASGGVTAAACVLALAVAGNTAPGLVLAVILTGPLLLLYCLADRRRLHLDELLALLPGGGRRG